MANSKSAKESTNLMNEAKRIMERTLNACVEKDIRDWSTIKYSIREVLKAFVYDEIKRNLMILPIIIEV